MKLTRFRLISAAIILPLATVIACHWWSNATGETVILPGMTPVTAMPFGPDASHLRLILTPLGGGNAPEAQTIPLLPPRLINEKLTPPDARQFRFNGQTIYIVLIS